MTRLFLFFTTLLLTSCGGPYTGKDLYGSDEFVLDSYKIREGKFSILEMEGFCVTELDESMLEESSFAAHGHVQLLGRVCTSSVPVDGKTRLFDVLSCAKVSPEANWFKSYVLRDSELLAVDLRKLVQEGDMSQNIVMKAGDKIYIAEENASSLIVMGEVGVEKTIPLPNGFISLRQALTDAGGIPYTGDPSYIQVIRGSLCSPKIYTLSLEHVLQLPNDSLLLMPGDVVCVAPKPITQWHRFISQLLPSFFQTK